MTQQPFKEVNSSFTTHVVVYVPSTDGSLKRRVDETISFCTKLFGGTTQVNAIGTYTGVKHNVIKERVAKVDIFTTPQNWELKKSKLHSWLKVKKRSWHQEELALEFEEDMYWI